MPATIRVKKVHRPSTARARQEGVVSLGTVTAQLLAVSTGDWLRVGVGCNVVLSLVVSAITGTLDVEIQTALTNETTPATLRTMDSFETVEAAGTKRMSFAATDEYIRYVATPGAGGDQTATYAITGSAVPVI